jgi:hypothetical protein
MSTTVTMLRGYKLDQVARDTFLAEITNIPTGAAKHGFETIAN